MKQLILLFISSAFFCSGLSAQNQGDHINLGVGLSGWGIPITGSYDWEFRGDFNLGVGASIAFDVDDDGSSSSETAFGVGFFTQWYADRVLDIPEDFDAYAGLGVFYYTRTSSDDLDLNLFIGGRYYFNDRIGFNLELGGGSALSGGKVGVSWKL